MSYQTYVLGADKFTVNPFGANAKMEPIAGDNLAYRFTYRLPLVELQEFIESTPPEVLAEMTFKVLVG